MKTFSLSTFYKAAALASLVALVSLPGYVSAKDKPKPKTKPTGVVQATPAPAVDTSAGDTAAPLPVQPTPTVRAVPADPSIASDTIPSPSTTVTTPVVPTVPPPRGDSPSGTQLGNAPIIPNAPVPAAPSRGGLRATDIPDSRGVTRSTGAGVGDASTSASPGAVTAVPSNSGSASSIGTAIPSDTAGGTGPSPAAGGRIPAGRVNPGTQPGTAPH